MFSGTQVHRNLRLKRPLSSVDKLRSGDVVLIRPTRDVIKVKVNAVKDGVVYGSSMTTSRWNNVNFGDPLEFSVLDVFTKQYDY